MSFWNALEAAVGRPFPERKNPRLQADNDLHRFRFDGVVPTTEGIAGDILGEMDSRYFELS